MSYSKRNRSQFPLRASAVPAALAALVLAFAHLMAWGQTPQIVGTPLGSHNLPKQVREGTAQLVEPYDPSAKLRLAISVKAPRMAEEEKFLKELQDKTSPNFHKYLSPAQWNARFAPAAEDEQAVVDWATQNGLSVTARYPNRLMVNVEGTVDSIQKAFNIHINRYRTVEGTVEFSNDRDPQIPQHLEGIIEFVDGLNSIHRMRPASAGMKGLRGPDYSPGPVHQLNPAVHRDAAAAAPKDLGKAGLPKGSGGQITGGYYDPTDFYSQEGYNYSGLQALGHCCNPYHISGHDGGGPVETSIGLATDGDFSDSDINGFFSHYPYLAGFYYHVHVNGTPGCCSDESTLDTEWSIAMSNSFGAGTDTAQVYNYEAAQGFGDFGTVFQQMLNDNLVRVVNISYGLPEYVFQQDAPGLLTSWHGIFNQMIGQGWTIMAASGDGGTTAGCSGAVAVLYPESDPDVVSVGGTDLQLNPDNTFSNEVAWVGDTFAGACSQNDGGGGGGCSAVWGAPGYQLSPACGTGSRSVPDVALHASIYPWANLYYNGSFGPGGAGTSLASPLMSGFIAQENAYSLAIGKSTVGEVDYDIYAEGGYNQSAPHYPFYDITAGCTSNDITIAYGTGAWCAGTGYDLATGWGSFNALQLAWAINWEDSLAYNSPSVAYSGPATNTWYNTDQAVSWTINANGNPLGIAGFTQGWDSIPADPFLDGNRNDSNSFFSGPQFPNATTGCLSLNGGFGCAGGVSQGCHYAHVNSWSNQGSTSGDTTYGPICYDTVAPSLSASNSPAANSYGYNKSTVTVSVAASDSTSGIKATYYGIDTLCNASNLGACAAYSGPVSVTTPGTHYVAYFTEDVAGNVTGPYYDYVYIDEVAPVSSIALAGTLSGGVYDTAVKVTLSATDNYSGVQSISYSLDGGATTSYAGAITVAGLGSHTVKYFSTDRAGNVEAVKSSTFSIASPTTTTLTVSPNHTLVGQNVLLTAKVAATLSGTPSGTVTFKSGATTVGTVALSGGIASLNTTKLPVGIDSLTATYAGAATFLGSTSSAFSEDVQQPSTVTITSSLNPSIFGESITFTAKVATANGFVPQDTIQILDGTTVLASLTLSGGQALYTTSALASGTHSMTAKYLGSSIYQGSTSPVLAETVNKDTTTTTLAVSPNPALNGQSVTLTAKVVAAHSGTPTGTVTFKNGTTTLGTETVTGGVATLTTASLPLGSDSLTASYSGDTNQLASNSSAVAEVVLEKTTTTVVSSLNPSGYTKSVSFTATVAPSISGTPTGTVNFFDGGSLLGTVSLTGGKATFATTNLAAGSHSITAVYSQSGPWGGSTSAALTQTVDKAATVIGLGSSINPSSFGQPVTFTATVKTSGQGYAVGTVTFRSGSNVIGTSNLNANGVGTLTISIVSVGTHAITAEYSGNSNYLASTSGVVNEVTTASATTTTVKSSSNPSTHGSSVTFTSTVVAATGPVPTGTVVFKDGATALGTGTLNGAGTATFSTSTLLSGTHSITAVYGGSTSDAASTSAVLSQVVH